ncbi:MAG: flotillin-like protein FloA [Planctomycetaceae bacterium]
MNDLLILAQDGDALIWGIAIVAFLVVLVLFAIFARYFGLWIQAKFTRANIGFFDLLVMSFRKVNPTVIVRSKIMAVQAGLTRQYPISTQALQGHYLAGGNVPNVIRSLIAANKAHIDLDWQVASAIDLAGRDVLEAVRTSVYPKVIDCPDPKRSAGTLDAVAGDGIQLKARARVTVRTNIKQLVGGATEETVIARVGQGIVQAIGSTASYKKVLENPDSISETVLQQGLEAQTAYEIVSIDIADVDVGDNIGARLQADQAEADMRVAQAKAEQRRADFAAREVEMVARTQENRAKVVLAEAEVPQAVSDAFRSNKIGLMDFYDLKNVQADTKMRSSIAGTSE